MHHPSPGDRVARDIAARLEHPLPAPFDTLPALFAGISRGEIPDRWAQRQPFLGEEAVAARIARVIQKAVTA